MIEGIEDGYQQESSPRVDASIAIIVAKLNLIGFKTRFSCSGLAEDHDEADGEIHEIQLNDGTTIVTFKTSVANAYLLFAQDPPASLARGLMPPLCLEGNRIGVGIVADLDKPEVPRMATDAELKAAWEAFDNWLTGAIKAATTQSQPTQ